LALFCSYLWWIRSTLKVDEIGFAIVRKLLSSWRLLLKSMQRSSNTMEAAQEAPRGMETANAVSDVLKELGMDSESYDADHDVSMGGDD
jgi:hypothetical protein